MAYRTVTTCGSRGNSFLVRHDHEVDRAILSAWWCRSGLFSETPFRENISATVGTVQGSMATVIAAGLEVSELSFAT